MKRKNIRKQIDRFVLIMGLTLIYITAVFAQPPQNIQPVEEPAPTSVVIKENKKECEDVVNLQRLNANCEDIKAIAQAFDYDLTTFAIIYYESGFNRMAKNVNKNGSIDLGVGQINQTIWGEHNKKKNNGLYFKQGDLNSTIAILKHCKKINGYDCWSSYTSGAYKRDLQKAKELLESIK